jgi:hypothetical protein
MELLLLLRMLRLLRVLVFVFRVAVLRAVAALMVRR